jgi:hypothetical protein
MLRMKTTLAATAALALMLALGACTKPADKTAEDTNTIGPQDSAVGKAMPDTSATPADNALQTAPSSLPGASATTPPTVPPAK